MIPVNEPVLGERESEYVQECLDSGWISSAGKFIDAFEQAWARYCGMEHGIAVSNGTVALQMALRALGLRPGDEVILPTFTIISCALAVVYNQAIPVLVDADPETWCMDVAQLESKLTDRTRAIMPVHIYGHPVDMDPVTQLAGDRSLWVIEDAAEAHGAEYLSQRHSEASQWRRAGAMGDLSVFSFYANKPITTGEGGMVLTNDEAVAEHLRSLRGLCYRKDRRFYHTELGFNFRMTNLQAAVGLAQVERVDQIVARKRWIGEQYTARLTGIVGLQLPSQRAWARQIYWMYGVVLDPSRGLTAAQLAEKLHAAGVQTRPFFLGMHRQPALLDRGFRLSGEFPVADRLSEYGLYLPSGLSITESQIDQVCDRLRAALQV